MVWCNLQVNLCDPYMSTLSVLQLRRYVNTYGDHSPDNVKSPDISLMVHGTPRLHSAC